MALEFAKELLGDAYTGELEEKLEAKINELYAPKADLDAASARADGLQEQDEKLAAAAFDAKIDKALADAKAHNPKLARGALDLDALRSSKNQDADIAAAIAAVQKSDAYLFAPEGAGTEPAPASGTGTSAVPGTAKYTADEIAMRKAADLPVD